MWKAELERCLSLRTPVGAQRDGDNAHTSAYTVPVNFRVARHNKRICEEQEPSNSLGAWDLA